MNLSRTPPSPQRITVMPKRWTACRDDAQWFRLHPDVIGYLPDVGTVRDEGDQAHLGTAVRALSGRLGSLVYLRAGGTSVHETCVIYAALPMMSPAWVPTTPPPRI